METKTYLAIVVAGLMLAMYLDWVAIDRGIGFTVGRVTYSWAFLVEVPLAVLVALRTAETRGRKTARAFFILMLVVFVIEAFVFGREITEGIMSALGVSE